MPYVRRRSRKTYKRRKRIYGRRKAASTKTVQKMIKRALRPHTEVIRKILNFDTTVSANVSWFHLNPIAGSNNIFDTAANDMHQNQAKHVRMDIDFLLSATNENDGTIFTMYLVSPKTSSQDAMFDGTTGQINLVQSEHYTYSNAIAYVNTNSFTIHRRWTAFFQPHGVGQPDVSLFKRKRLVIRPNTFIRNIKGDFGDLVCPQKPSQNYYLLVFTTNLVADLESPTVQMSVLNTYIA